MGKSARTMQPGYNVWSLMKQRCNNPKAANYAAYGGRGIRYCARWELFDNFIADMGPPPPNTTLDRKDNDGDYTPNNCRWSSSETQQNNRRNNVFVEYAGERFTVAQWARKLSVSPDVILYRLSEKWPLEKVLDGVVVPHTRRVAQYKNGVLLTVYASFAEAGKALGRDKRGIWNAASGNGKTAYGFEWRYAD